jgi:hypothetical protein
MVARDVRYDIAGLALAKAANPPSRVSAQSGAAQKTALKARPRKARRRHDEKPFRKNLFPNALHPAMAVQESGM